MSKHFQKAIRDAKNRGILTYSHLKSFNNNSEELKHTTGECVISEGLCIFEKKEKLIIEKTNLELVNGGHGSKILVNPNSGIIINSFLTPVLTFRAI